ncbi:PAP2 superfamily protein [Zalerion maritima]|uniref:PAP2 superfamily protein n=1 Tax=Zalerion maritima TaxID=339359 RepID=A0AAD5RRC6_9PEZI|nr:PAP2 superfamily protein [Zalerion maritima]
MLSDYVPSTLPFELSSFHRLPTAANTGVRSPFVSQTADPASPLLTTTAATMQDWNTMLSKAKPSIPFPLNLGKLNPIPHRYRIGRRRKGRSRYELEDITTLNYSFDMRETLQRLRRHGWSMYDLQYLLLLGIAIFSLAISEMHVLFKFAFTALITTLFLMPITNQFFWPGAAIWTYLLYFFTSRFIPVESRPHIWVKVLPALENVLYGANLSNILSAHTHAFLDVLAWLPYGILHFSLPFVISAAIFLYAAPGTTPVWARAFGWMNIVGVTIQLVFPCTPPWYETKHGLDTPAYYGMEGDPAGLARIDKLFGFDMYTTTFTTAPLPFGAFPSLHAGNATIEAFFLSYLFPRLRPLFIAYVGWIWWATMYLSHHYAVDLVGGSFLASICYFYARAYWLPRRQSDKASRWEYEYTEIGESTRSSDEASLPFHNLENAREPRRSSSDEWTLASSSGYSTSSASGSGSGTLSPAPGFEERGWESDSSQTSHTSKSPAESRSPALTEVVVR